MYIFKKNVCFVSVECLKTDDQDRMSELKKKQELENQELMNWKQGLILPSLLVTVQYSCYNKKMKTFNLKRWRLSESAFFLFAAIHIILLLLFFAFNRLRLYGDSQNKNSQFILIYSLREAFKKKKKLHISWTVPERGGEGSTQTQTGLRKSGTVPEICSFFPN